MITISQDTAYERWDQLPDVLCDALFSEPNSDFIWKISETENVPEEKIYDIARISGYVLMGFLHPEDVAGEIYETIGVDKKTANIIEEKLNNRIFAPLRQDIDKVYSPISKPTIIQGQAATTAPTAPKPATPPGAPGPKIISETFNAMPKIGGTPLASNANNAAAAPQAPKAPSDAGWSSKKPLQQPVVKLGAITPGVPTPAKPAMPATSAKPAGTGAVTSPNAAPIKTTSSISQPAAPAASPATSTPAAQAQPAKKATMSEFERLDMMKKAAPPQPAQTQRAQIPAAQPMQKPSVTPPPSQAQATPTSASAAPIPTPPPVMLHQTSDATAQSPTFQFKTGMQNQMTNRPAGSNSLPTQSAVLELGKTPTQDPSMSKVVHYSEYQTPVPTPTAPAADAEPRQINEVTTPPAKGKVIVQDFLN